FQDAALWEVVGTTPVITGLNYNVEGQQDVCVGESAVLQTMTNVLNHLRIEKIDVAKVRLRFSSWPSPSNCMSLDHGDFHSIRRDILRLYHPLHLPRLTSDVEAESWLDGIHTYSMVWYLALCPRRRCHQRRRW
ncbi:hypothetical protein BD779DRAFT_1454544, partial [Infundibulicybe gibba]